MTDTAAAAPAPAPVPPVPMTARQRFTLVAMSFGLLMIFLDALIVNVALPAIQDSFAVGESGLQWVVAAYSLGMAVAIMTGATLADLYGRRRLFIAVVVFPRTRAVAPDRSPP